MTKQLMTIVSKATIAKDTIEMKLSIDPAVARIAQPGQFLHINVSEGYGHLLRRPISIADVNLQEASITIIFKVIGSGTDALQKRGIGQEIDALVPCGTSYPIESLALNKALLIGGGIGVPPLYFLAKKLKEQGVEVTAVIGFQSKDHVFYEQQFKEIGTVHVVTDDGSYGHKGYVTNVIDEQAIDFDYFFSCGPTGMLKAVSHKLQDYHGYISIEQRMGCGIGACYACVVPSTTEPGFKKICKDGPVFKANEVVLS
ncbi:dihydroorotate dehydrogenase electron transfer subunit [Radiobacillus sp. PE A8.2]|uniref:dihydroorotate dehydrogenase electron transfer subunit n=1 Tax=Radiobacillus sp. PE A8.2 TaxID=3380349 RepID=UPI0038906479